MNEEFVNVYIETNNKKIEELIRNEMLLQTRLIIAERAVNKLNDEKKKFFEEIESIKQAKNELVQNYNERIKQLMEDNKDLEIHIEKLNEEIKSLQAAVLLVAETEKIDKKSKAAEKENLF